MSATLCKFSRTHKAPYQGQACFNVEIEGTPEVRNEDGAYLSQSTMLNPSGSSDGSSSRKSMSVLPKKPLHSYAISYQRKS